MSFVHVRSLEKYHPGYKDRELQWAKIYFKMVQGDPDCETIQDEVDWGRLIKIILLELEAKQPLPNSNIYWTRKGFDIKKRPMSLTLKMLHNFLEIVETCNVDKEKEEEKDKDQELYVDFEEVVLQDWNSFCEKHPKLSKVRSISGTRRKKLKIRFTEKDFKNFKQILKAAEDQSFLLTGNPNSKDHANWVMSFDWLITNDTNYMKVLEYRYRGIEKSKPQQQKIDNIYKPPDQPDPEQRKKVAELISQTAREMRIN